MQKKTQQRVCNLKPFVFTVFGEFVNSICNISLRNVRKAVNIMIFFQFKKICRIKIQFYEFINIEKENEHLGMDGTGAIRRRDKKTRSKAPPGVLNSGLGQPIVRLRASKGLVTVMLTNEKLHFSWRKW